MKHSAATVVLVTPASNSSDVSGSGSEGSVTTLAQPLVRVVGLSAGYGNRDVLQDIDIAVSQGEFVGLLGPNGSGKSTLLHSITGYLPATSGKIEIEGRPLRQLSRRQIAESIAFVPQKTESTFVFTSLDMVLMGRHPFAGFNAADSGEDIDRAMAALNELQIEALADRPFGNLSGGEQQLVLLARSFAQASPLLLLDEPLTGLDIRHQFQLMSAIKARTANELNGALATFHDLAAATRWCTRVILLHDGTVEADGPPVFALTPQVLSRVYGVNASVTTNPDGHGLSIYVNESVPVPL